MTSSMRITFYTKALPLLYPLHSLLNRHVSPGGDFIVPGVADGGEGCVQDHRVAAVYGPWGPVGDAGVIGVSGPRKGDPGVCDGCGEVMAVRAFTGQGHIVDNVENERDFERMTGLEQAAHEIRFPVEGIEEDIGRAPRRFSVSQDHGGTMGAFA